MDIHPIWQPVTYRVGDAHRYDIGPLSLLVSRRYEEWHIRYHICHEPLREVFEYSAASMDETLSDSDVIERIAAHDSQDLRQLQLKPLLADRYVSARPETPVTIAAGSWAAMYLTTPLWLQLTRLPDKQALLELSSFRPVDTWLGPPTGEGPLAYASSVRGRLRHQDLIPSPMRALTKVTLRNSGSAPMRIARIIVPAPELRLYRSKETDRFWTDEITITKGRDGELSEVRIESRAPVEAGEIEHIADARTPPSANLFDRAFSTLWGG